MALGLAGGQRGSTHRAASTPKVRFGAAAIRKPGGGDSYRTAALPLVKKYCLECHSAKAKRGGLDLERFASRNDLRGDLKPWQRVVDHLDVGDMPPFGRPQPSAGEKNQLVGWVRALLADEGRARAGDPGYVPLRRLSNAEYDCTIRDLTGVDLRPTREFPADGAAGEGFTNAAEALTDISPDLLAKYFAASKDIADHVALLPDGFRVSPGKTRRDWTDESTARLRKFFTAYTGPDGSLPVQPYLAATVRHRTALLAGTSTTDAIASREKLNPKYLQILWRTLNDKTPSYPLDALRARWRTAAESDLPELARDVTAWQATLWQVARVGSYVRPVGQGFAESTSRQVAVDPPAVESQLFRVTFKPQPGQNEVALTLASRSLTGPGGQVVWQRPRLEAAGKPPLLLRDYADFGRAYEVDYRAAFADTARYLAAAVDAAGENSLTSTVEQAAARHKLDAERLAGWMSVLAIEPRAGAGTNELSGRVVPAVPLELLDEKIAKDGGRAAINGWRRKGADLPVLVTNASDTVENIPGRASPHGVMVHPTPTEFVAVAWTSPIAGSVTVAARITHAHPNCGNGVAWWLEHRRGDRAADFAEGAIELGGTAAPGQQTLRVEKGDLIVLAVDAKNGDHSCDLTDVALKITSAADPSRVWDLAADIADNVLAGNPHGDRHGVKQVWSFVKGPSRPVAAAATRVVPPDSVLGRWREAATDPNRKAEAVRLAEQAQSLLSGSGEAGGQGSGAGDQKSAGTAGQADPDTMLYRNLAGAGSPLFAGIDPARLPKIRPGATAFGLPKDRFGARAGGLTVDDASLVTPAGSVIEVRLPAALAQGRTFVVEGTLDRASPDRAAAFQALANAPGGSLSWIGQGPIVAAPGGSAYKRLTEDCEAFRRCFPLFLCFPNVIPNDEVVSLKMFHREDEPLSRLFLSAAEARRLDYLWAEHDYVSRQAELENEHLPLFIGFVTQDQPKTMLAFFEGQRPAFRKRAEAFEVAEKAAALSQWKALFDFASRAYRRPLRDIEKRELRGLYDSLRAKRAPHEEAFRGVVARILVSPAFLFRIEQAPGGNKAAPIADWELATRLSYFLWSSAPDDTLRVLAASGRLNDPGVLAAQAERMLKDDRVRAMAIEFGTQWLKVRGFDELKEKNERLFPTFDAGLRKAIYEESILFFQDMFQSDRPVTSLLDADYTFVNETLAKHYGIPGVSGPEWRRIDGVRKFGRGGVLGLASVQTKEAGASRTSPVLRGNWLVETLLGEKLPRPPANVPKLPEEEGAAPLTLRQEVEKHTRNPSCAVCHVRIDPYGFALERYDAIGRFRDKELGGLAVDTKAKLKDGTEFEGIDGLRTYLLSKKKDVIVRLFCRRLLGYALGRSVTLSDGPLLDTMMAALNKREGRISAAVLTIVQSPQFRMIRGRESGSEPARRKKD